ncbi:hypothetical protein IQ218_02190 [Synechocystis salina LEGE 06099]|uniref:DUF6883 domain-containing protein n=1 Tax=Synechocystis salina TaxID=945780 RepID=UPI001881A865|nr:DUF6883 domain-containing protein [Synechocystis salina]MBE9202496.1 hypothetical protein [Synechocystis salina LEGE 06099]
MKLPNPHQAYIDDQKLMGYSLNFSHADGRHKARVFKSALGITTENLEILKNSLAQAVLTYEATPDKVNQYGQKYVIDFSMTHQNKTAIIHSVWIVREDENFPRLVTCYVKE